MNSIPSGFAVLALLAYASAAVDFDGCVRGHLIIEDASRISSMRKDIQKDLGFSLDVNGTLAGVAVQDKNRTQTMFVAFAGRNKKMEERDQLCNVDCQRQNVRYLANRECEFGIAYS